MAELRVISAGAGTGKTHRLATELLEALTGPDPVAPEGVVAVTYTRAASAELETRVRTRLIDEGQGDLARRLAAARIGTVHSVAARLVEEHAFALGLSPELETIDDSVAQALFEDALAASVNDDERRALDDLEQRLTLGAGAAAFFRQVRDVVNRARSNELGDDELARSCDLSVSSLAAMWTDPRPGAELDAELAGAIGDCLIRAKDVGTAMWREGIEQLRRIKAQLDAGDALPWSTWRALEDTRFHAVRAVAKRHVDHQRLHADLERLTRLVFAVARKTMARYESDKRASGVIDFTDQERLALMAVENEAVAQALRADVQLLLVDEFQDTSPLQMRLFAALQGVARRTVIVGDEKQSIYAFRDAKPELFAAMAAGAASTDRLDVSYRSRPTLVAAVSSVFSSAFSAHHSKDEVALKAHLEVEPPGLGAHIERWTADVDPNSGERVDETDIIAAGVVEVLRGRGDGDDVLVRPTRREDAGVRPAMARDIAVLARTNTACRNIAKALHKRGVAVVLGRRGLSKTFEARLISAALAVWLDDGDTLARLSLLHMLGAGDADADDAAAVDAIDVVSAAAVAPAGEALKDHAVIVAVAEAAAAAPVAGVVAAFDRVVDVLRLNDHLARLSFPAQRLADLAALRALALRFVDECVARGRGPTIAGYLDRLESLRLSARAGDDDVGDDDVRGVVAGEDAVTVITYHRSKGKEWPVVILANLSWDMGVRPFELAVEAQAERDDADDDSSDGDDNSDNDGGDDNNDNDGGVYTPPTLAPWLRAWPSPYGKGVRKGALIELLKASPIMKRAELRHREEERRLLYVSWTRARDRLVLVGDQNLYLRGMMRAVLIGERPIVGDPDSNGVASWGGVPVRMVVRRPALKGKGLERGTTLVMPPRQISSRPTRAPMFQQPSAQEGVGVVGERIALGGPIVVDAVERDDLNHLGQCVHAFLAWDAANPQSGAARVVRAQHMLERFTVHERATAEQLCMIGDRLWSAIDVRFVGHRRRTEVAVTHRRSSGSIVRGQIDLLLDGPDVVIVDHKTTWDDDVAGYAGQLASYRDAVAAAGLGEAKTYIHLPLLGALVEVIVSDVVGDAAAEGAVAEADIADDV